LIFDKELHWVIVTDDYNLQILPDDVNIPQILNFEDCNVRGGAFGKVYPSTLGGSEVAVKMIKTQAKDPTKAKQDFDNEIKILR